MVDKYGRICDEISKRLPNQSDKVLLEKLVETYEKLGRRGVEMEIEEMIEKVGADA